jgi:fatty acid-binding protein DegV
MKIALVTDSTCDLPPALVEQARVAVAPIHIMWGQEAFIDGVTIHADEFYKRLSTDPVIPKTSQPSPGVFAP